MVMDVWVGPGGRTAKSEEALLREEQGNRAGVSGALYTCAANPALAAAHEDFAKRQQTEHASAAVVRVVARPGSPGVNDATLSLFAAAQ